MATADTSEETDRLFAVTIESELYGTTTAVVRRLSARGVVVEMVYTPPLGTMLRLRFENFCDEPGAALLATVEVVAHVAPSNRLRAVVLRVVEFVHDGATIEPMQ